MLSSEGEGSLLFLEPKVEVNLGSPRGDSGQSVVGVVSLSCFVQVKPLVLGGLRVRVPFSV